MAVYAFQSGIDREILAFTSQRDGYNLPTRHAPWKCVAQAGMQDDSVTHAAISLDGYLLVRSSVRIVNRLPTDT